MNMPSLVRSFTTVALLSAASATVAVAEEKKDIIIKRPEKGPVPKFEKRLSDLPVPEMEKVTFLGVESVPAGRALASQLGLTPETGLVVLRVMADSPAASALQEHDILTKFDDQMLIDPRQLSVLVRGRKEGDEVKLTVIRAGKEQVQKVKLGRREVPKVAGMPMPPGAGPDVRFFHEGMPGPDGDWARRLPGMDHDDIRNVMRMIGNERRHWFNGPPPVHFFTQNDNEGSTILNLAEGNFVFTDNEGSVEVQAADGHRELMVKDEDGKVLFQGPINTEGEREKLPPEVLARLEQIQNAELGTEPGEDFEQETAVEPPTKAKISLPRAPRAPRFPAPTPPL